MQKSPSGSEWVKNVVAAEDAVQAINENLAATTLPEREARIIRVRVEYLAVDIDSTKKYGGSVPIDELNDLLNYTTNSRSELT